MPLVFTIPLISLLLATASSDNLLPEDPIVVCIPLVSKNPIGNPYHPALVGANHANVKQGLGDGGLIQGLSSLYCPVSAPEPCRRTVAGEVSLTQSIAMSVTDSRSQSFRHSVSSAEGFSESDSFTKSIAKSIERGFSLTESENEEASISDTISDALTKSHERSRTKAVTTSREDSRGGSWSKTFGNEWSTSSQKSYTNTIGFERSKGTSFTTSDEVSVGSGTTSEDTVSDTDTSEHSSTAGTSFERGIQVSQSREESQTTGTTWENTNSDTVSAEVSATASFGGMFSPVSGSVTATAGTSSTNTESRGGSSSGTMGTSDTRGSTSNRGRTRSATFGGSRARNRARTKGSSTSYNKAHSESATRDDRVTDSVSNAVTDSHTINTGSSESTTDSVTWNQMLGRSETDSHTDTEGESRTRSKARTVSKTVSRGTSKTNSKTEGRTEEDSSTKTKSFERTFTRGADEGAETSVSHGTVRTTSTTLSVSSSDEFTIRPGECVKAVCLQHLDVVVVPYSCADSNGVETVRYAEISRVRKNVPCSVTMIKCAEDERRIRVDSDNHLTRLKPENMLTSHEEPLTQQKSKTSGEYELKFVDGNLQLAKKGFENVIWTTGLENMKNYAMRARITEKGHFIVEAQNIFADMSYRRNQWITVWSTQSVAHNYTVGMPRKADQTMDGYRLVLEDGNLVLYDAVNIVIWCAASTHVRRCVHGYKHPDVYLMPTYHVTAEPYRFQNDPHNSLGSAELVGNGSLWSLDEHCTNVLKQNTGIKSPNGRFKLILQTTGNLVIKDGSRTMWSSYTADIPGTQPPYALVLDHNKGNMVILDASYLWVWSTINIINNTAGRYQADLEDEGRLVIKDSDGLEVWESWPIRNNSNDMILAHLGIRSWRCKGYDCFGNDISSHSGSLQDCVDRCERSSECKGLAHNPTLNKCWLKKQMKDCRKSKQDIVTVIPNYECPNHVIDTKGVINLEACVHACRDADNCFGAFYKSRKCYLKSKMEHCRLHNHGISVWVREPLVREGLWCQGHDLEHRRDLSLRMCHALCEQHSHCAGTILDLKSQGCWLKSRLSHCLSSSASPLVVMIPGEDCRGNDEFIGRNVTLDQCVDAGRSHYHVTGAKFDNGVCWLKSKTSDCRKSDPGTTVFIQDPESPLGYDCKGNDMSPGFHGTTLDGCVEICREKRGCKAAAFVHNTGTCWLKSALEWCGPTSLPVSMVLVGTDCAHNDIASFDQDTTLADCISKCRANAACIAVQYNFRHNSCFLKAKALRCGDSADGNMIIFRHPELIRGYDCRGNDIDSHSDLDIDECSVKCHEKHGCIGYSYQLAERKCWLKSATEGCRSIPEAIVTVLTNQDCDGNDITWFEPTTPEECVKKCQETPQCVGVQFSRRTSCFLKHKLAACSSYDDGTIIHVRSATPRNGYDCPFNDFQHLQDVSIEHCRTKCKENPSCQGFAYKMPRRECWLKSKLENCAKHEDSVITVKVNHDCPGNDIGSVTVDNMDECVQRCFADPSCMGVQLTPDNLCWFKARMANCEYDGGVSIRLFQWDDYL